MKPAKSSSQRKPTAASRPAAAAKKPGSEDASTVAKPRPAKQRAAKGVNGKAAASGAKDSTAPTKPAPPSAEQAVAAIPESPEPSSWRSMFRDLPGWAASAIVHAIVLLMFALLTVAPPEAFDGFSLASTSDRSAEEEEIEELEMDEPIELEQVDDMPTVPSNLIDPGAISLGSLPMAGANASEVTVDAIGDADMSMEIGELFGDKGTGLADSGVGKGAATFFGVQSSGQRFVFVVDNSNSMNNGKFETAVYELMKSVASLDRYQQFYVIFFSDAAYPLYYPHSAERFVPATDENKLKMEYWLRTVERCLQTRGIEAMQLAFDLRPDTIFILGDGAFTDKAVPEVLARAEGSRVVIHTLGFKMTGKARDGFESIAKAFRGTFTDVEVTPAMVALSKKLNRPKNNSRNGVWGINLGKKKKK